MKGDYQEIKLTKAALGQGPSRPEFSSEPFDLNKECARVCLENGSYQLPVSETSLSCRFGFLRYLAEENPFPFYQSRPQPQSLSRSPPAASDGPVPNSSPPRS
ncbi:hypothetical protein EVAR_81436_1 [Eumeta japonica]|uniref:Uncharacterized protein n=1 Tax=Eumeta variegata TaxID=151549 RepID=A0A4C1W229_EUMVA|nr:hypothetical protein EVAR_81436_1 [Eumeta japonica]